MGQGAVFRWQASVQANASVDSLKPRFAVEAHVATLFGTQAERVGDEREQECSQEDAAFGEQGAPEAPALLPTSLSQEEQAALAQHNAARHEWIEELGAQDRSVSGRGSQCMADLRVSTTDPDATLMPTKDGVDMGYHTHYVVDGGKARIILQVLVTPMARDGQSAHARSALACALPLEVVARASHR